MDKGYWSPRVLRERRIGRRRALGLAGGAATILIGAAACGSGANGSKPSASPTGNALTKPVDTTGSATTGGTFGGFFPTDVTSHDPLGAASVTIQSNLAIWVYSRLLKWQPGVLATAPGLAEGDLAASWEIASDSLSWTLKLRPQAKWDNRAPTNSRAVDADDVVFSWNKFAALSTYRGDLAHAASPIAPIDSMQAVDPATVLVKLASPSAMVADLLASTVHLWIMPRESDGQFDPKQVARGSGPWYEKSYEQSVGFEYAKNPNWYRNDRPFLDGWSGPIVSEPANQLAQFRAGNIWMGGVNQDDILQTKSDLPQLLMLAGQDFPLNVDQVFFGYAGDSPWSDDRVRRALSIVIDRATYGDTFNNLAQFRKQGLDQEVRWASHVGGGWDGIWLDPTGTDLGDGAANFKFDKAEARKLLDAAGYAGKNVSTTALFPATPVYGTVFPQQVQAIIGMLRDGGFDVEQKPLDYQSEFLPKVHFAKGNFSGMSFTPSAARGDLGLFLSTFYHPDGSAYHLNPGGDPQLSKMIEAQLVEFDRSKRVGLFQNIQKYMAKTMPVVPYRVDSPGFSLSWPWVGNAGVYRKYNPSLSAEPTETYINLWYDKSRRS